MISDMLWDWQHVVTSVWAASLWRAVWQGGLALLFVWGLCRIWRTMPSNLRVWCWRLALLKVLIAFIWTTPVTLGILPSPPPPALSSTTITAPTQPTSHSLAPSTVTLPEESVAATPPVDSWPVSTAVPVSNTWTFSPAHLLLLLGLVWLFGIGWRMIIFLIGCRSVRQLRMACRPLTDEKIQTLVADLAKRLQLSRIPDLLVGEVESPLLIGGGRPAIVLPAANLTTTDPAVLELMLAHELAHIRRHDLRWGWLPLLVDLLFFFHPLVWVARREHRLAQEIACDALAIKVAGTSEATYGAMLVDVASQRRTLEPQPALVTVGIVESFHSLHRRLHAMKDFHRISRKAVLFGGLLIGLLALAGLIPWRLAKAQQDTSAQMLVPQVGNNGQIQSIAVSPDSRYLAALDGKNVVIWDLARGMINDRISGIGQTDRVEFSTDGQSFYLSSDMQNLSRWDVRTGKPLQWYNTNKNRIWLTQDNKYIWTIVRDSPYRQTSTPLTLACLEANTGEVIRTVPDLEGRLVDINPAGTRVVTSVVLPGKYGMEIPSGNLLNPKTELVQWDLSTGKRLGSFEQSTDSRLSFYSPDGNYFASSMSKEATYAIYLWDTATGKLLHKMTAHKDNILSLRFSPNNQYLATTGEDQRVVLWDVATGKLVRQWTDLGKVGQLAFTPDSSQLVVTTARDVIDHFSGPGPIIVLGLASGNIVRTLTPSALEEPLYSTAVNARQHLIAAGYYERIVLWDANTGQVTHEIELPDKMLPPMMTFNSTGTRLLVGALKLPVKGPGGQTLIINTQTGVIEHQIENSDDMFPPNPYVSPDGTLALMHGCSMAATIWKTEDWSTMQKIKVQQNKYQVIPFPFTFSPDNKRLAAQYYYGIVVWDIATGKVIRSTGDIILDPADATAAPTMTTAGNSIKPIEEAQKHTRYQDEKLTYSPDGKWLVSTRSAADKVDSPATGQKELQTIWTAIVVRDAETLEELKLIKLPCMRPFTMNPNLTFSLDGKRVYVGTQDGYVYEVALAAGTVRQVFHQEGRELSNIGLLDDRLVTMSIFGLVQIWKIDAQTPELLATLYSFEKAKWLAMTPQGYYNCSDQAEDLIAWKVDGTTVKDPQLNAKYLQPGRVEQILRGK